MAAESIPVAPLSIWNPVHLGTDELGRRVEVTLAERNMLILSLIHISEPTRPY